MDTLALELVFLFPHNDLTMSRNPSVYTTLPQQNSYFHGGGKPENTNKVNGLWGKYTERHSVRQVDNFACFDA